LFKIINKTIILFKMKNLSLLLILIQLMLTCIGQSQTNPYPTDAKTLLKNGLKYLNGDGVCVDPSLGEKLILKAAEQGYTKAEVDLGCVYLKGQGGVTADKELAVKWLKKAAAKGDSDAEMILGVCYDHGEGVKKDYIESVKWYRKAADKGMPAAQYNLALMYVRGDGIPLNKIEAYKWFIIALAGGVSDSRECLDKFFKDLKPEQKEEAEKLAAEWKPKKSWF
jgi:uncharacterized protein